MKYVWLKNSRVYHKAVDVSGDNYWVYFGTACHSFVRLVNDGAEISSKPPKFRGFPDLFRPCKRCFPEDAIEESDRISRELDDAERLQNE